MRKQNLGLEKILEKIGSKYEAVVRMSIAANKISDGEITLERPTSEKVTTSAMDRYVAEANAAKPAATPGEKA
jgi:DNA-directed RNA polymerase subunit K/omega